LSTGLQIVGFFTGMLICGLGPGVIFSNPMDAYPAPLRFLASHPRADHGQLDAVDKVAPESRPGPPLSYLFATPGGVTEFRRAHLIHVASALDR